MRQVRRRLAGPVKLPNGVPTLSPVDCEILSACLAGSLTADPEPGDQWTTELLTIDHAGSVPPSGVIPWMPGLLAQPARDPGMPKGIGFLTVVDA